LRNIPRTKLIKQSSCYQTSPVGGVVQADFINAVACLETDLAPLALLEALFAIERQHQRQRTLRWGPRTLDLDLLLYGNLTINISTLIVPHKELKNRQFVIHPLLEIAPNIKLPDNEPVSQYLDKDSVFLKKI
jgi:2-amino-4-hydroxy-6-hydroxymethyldihydropteridine diphosphokinase